MGPARARICFPYERTRSRKRQGEVHGAKRALQWTTCSYPSLPSLGPTPPKKGQCEQAQYFLVLYPFRLSLNHGLQADHLCSYKRLISASREIRIVYIRMGPFLHLSHSNCVPLLESRRACSNVFSSAFSSLFRKERPFCVHTQFTHSEHSFLPMIISCQASRTVTATERLA